MCENQELCTKPKALTGNAFFCAEMTCKSRARFPCPDRRGLWYKWPMNRQEILDRLKEKAAPSPAATLEVDTERAARVFMKRIEGAYPAIEGLVFGSRARGTHKPDSDADLAVILKGEHGDRYKVAGDMAGIAFDVMLETGVRIDPLPLWEDELLRPDLFSYPALIENIQREGLRL